jgi:NADH-quinone oxidoreductase subunit H
MGASSFEVLVNLIKMLAIFLLMVQLVPILVWVERRGSAFIQNRFGPNRVGPLGLTQLLADAVKFLFKEEFRPPKSVAFLYYAAPVVALIPGALAFGSIPLSAPFTLEYGGEKIPFLFQSFNLGIGIVFVLGISSLGAYALLFAGWGSGNKYSLMGALRASAQMISYELALGLSLVGILLIFGSFSFAEIIEAQRGPLTFAFFGTTVVLPLPNWGIFYQPLGFILFFAATFAETNRAPFDLPEAEAELVAGYHTEYGGLKMLMFYIGEYGHMMVASALIVTFYLGGWDLPWGSDWLKASIGSDFLYSLTMHLVFMGKVLLFLWIFIWVRWTLPRFRYDQLMDLGWKTMLPWALFNTVATAIIVVLFNSAGSV